MPKRKSTDTTGIEASRLGKHPTMPSKSNLTAEDWTAVERHAEALDTRLFGAPVHQTKEEQSAEIGATIKRILREVSPEESRKQYASLFLGL